MTTGNPKIDIWLFVAGWALWVISEALGKSKRFRANGIIEFFMHFVQAGGRAQRLLRPA